MRSAIVVSLCAAVAGCHSVESVPIATTPPASSPVASAPAVASAAPADAPAGPCTAQAARAVSVAMRPHSTEQFGQLDAGTSVDVSARSRDGWLGFDPAVAQAANVGPFRLRWLDPAQISTAGDCAQVPVVWTPKPGVCFEMPMEDVVVREAPREGARAVATIHPGEFAALVGRVGKEWAQVDLSAGERASTVRGFISADAVNVNGPCDEITGPGG